MNKLNAHRSNIILLCILFVVCFITTFCLKQLYNQTANWAYLVFNREQWVRDLNYFRFSTFLLQTPALLASKFGASVKTSVWLFCFGYFIYPFAALAYLYRFLKKHHKIDLLYPLIATFILTIIPVWGFANAIATESIVIFWFIYVYIIVVEKPRIIVLALLSLGLAFSYEISAMLYGLMVYILWREKKLTHPNFILAVTMVLFQFYNLLYRIIPAAGHEHFDMSPSRIFASPFWVLIITFFLSLWILSPQSKIARRHAVSVSMIGGLLTLGLLLYAHPRDLWYQSYHNRTWCIPLGMIIFFAFYEYLRANEMKLDDLARKIFPLLFVSAICVEAKLGLDSLKMTSILEDLTHQKEGCYVISVEEAKSISQGSMLPSWDLPALSVLLNGDLKVRTVLVRDFPENTRGPDAHCRLNKEKNRLIYAERFGDAHLILDAKFDYSGITGQK